MKKQIKQRFLIATLLSLGLQANAQKKDLSTSVTFGLTTEMLNQSGGFSIGINPSYPLFSHLSIEGQISYLYTNISHSFLSGRKGKSNSVNVLVGGRVYLNAEEKRKRLYFNLLVGANYTNRELSGLNLNDEFGGGLSLGVGCKWSEFLIGVSYETPFNLVLKIGHVF